MSSCDEASNDKKNHLQSNERQASSQKLKSGTSAELESRKTRAIPSVDKTADGLENASEMERYAVTDADAGFKVCLAILDEKKREQALLELLKNVKASNVKLSQEIITQFPKGEIRADALKTFVDDWATWNPEASLRWAETLENSEKQLAVGAWCLALGASDLQTVLEAAATKLQDESLQAQMSQKWLKYWAEQDKAYSKECIESLPDGAFKEAALSTLESFMPKK